MVYRLRVFLAVVHASAAGLRYQFADSLSARMQDVFVHPQKLVPIIQLCKFMVDEEIPADAYMLGPDDTQIVIGDNSLSDNVTNYKFIEFTVALCPTDHPLVTRLQQVPCFDLADLDTALTGVEKLLRKSVEQINNQRLPK